MKMSELASLIEQFAPASFAEDWDNVGLLVGRGSKEIHSLLLAVDATTEVVEEAVRLGVDAVITHHPLIFRGIKAVNDTDFIGRRVLKLAQNDICLYAMHTNFDVMGMADAAADVLKLNDREVLSVTFEDDLSREGLGRTGSLPEHMTLRELAVHVRDSFSIPDVRFFGDPNQPIVTCAILPGSGGSEIDTVIRSGVDVYITGDIDHHQGIDAVERGVAVIDAGHYGIEKIFLPYMKDFLAREAPQIRVLQSSQKDPFETV